MIRTHRVPIIGVVGGIGSGKTAFSLALEELGCRRFEADRVGHDMLNKVDIYAELVQTFGQEILGPDDRIDRAALARRAFDTPEHAAELNRIVGEALWPEFRRRALEAADHADPEKIQGVVLDAALLYESETEDLCDAVVFVDAPEDQRRRRIHETRGWDWDEVLRRERHQFPLSRKRAMADEVCVNDADLAHLRSEARRILTAVRKRFFSHDNRTGSSLRTSSGGPD